jgi:hypothetical protein
MTTQTVQSTQSKPVPQAPSKMARWFPIGIWLPISPSLSNGSRLMVKVIIGGDTAHRKYPASN